MERSTAAPYPSRPRLEENSGGSCLPVAATGTGPASRCLTSAMVAAACSYERVRSSSAKTLASSVTSWRRWSKATSTSVIITARSGMPVSSGLGAPTVGSALRARS